MINRFESHFTSMSLDYVSTDYESIGYEGIDQADVKENIRSGKSCLNIPLINIR